MNATEKSIKVFISYSHDSSEHAEQVLALSNRLRADGIDAMIDQYVVPPPEDWKLWMEKQIRDADFVLMICTDTYYRRVMGEELSGKGLGVRWEGKLIYQQLYQVGSETGRAKFIPVLLEGGSVEHIPLPVRGNIFYQLDSEAMYDNLYRHLTGQPITVMPELGQQRTLPQKEQKIPYFPTQTDTQPEEVQPSDKKQDHIQAKGDAFCQQEKHVRNLIPRFIHDHYQQGIVEGTFDAVTMFVDVAGFTAMTETLMQHGPEGAEVLAEVMNTVFHLLVETVYEQGGFISIFAGDAFTAIFPTERDGLSETTILHGLACIEKIQDIFLHHGIHKTRFGQFDLQFKVGLSYGRVKWGIFGETQKTYFFRGDAIKACAEAEHHADRGDIIFDERLAQHLAKIPGVSGSEWNIEKLHVDAYRLHEIPRALQKRLPAPQLIRETPLRREILAQFLPERILEFSEIGEFRYIASVFLGFQGFSSDKTLHNWGSLLLDQITDYGGHLCQFDFSDKGNTVFCVFGAPVGLENPVERALECLWAIRKALKDSASLAGLEFRAGVTYGMAYVGIVGGEQRCVYSYYSKIVNLSARLMARAAWGDILVPQDILKKTDLFSFRHQGDFPYKGFPAPIPTYSLFRRKYGVRKRAFSDKLVGREQELRQLRTSLAPIFENRFAGVLYIYGEAGIGKSHLAYTLQQELTETHDMNWFFCPVDHIFQKPFNPFITFLSEYFECSPELSAELNKAHFENVYTALIEAIDYLLTAPEEEIKTDFPTFTRELCEHLRAELLRTKSVIGAQLGLCWTDSLWEHLDAKGKHENTLNALKSFFLVQSLFNPTVIEIEDGHWLDNDSREFVDVLTRSIDHYPILILATIRYNDDGSKPDFHLKGIVEQTLHLHYLPESDVKLHAETELQGSISDALQTLLAEKTRGNPFFVQQMIRYFKEEGFIIQQHQHWQLVKDTSGVPDSIENILIARLDRLSVEVKEAVKTAAVIGREFEIQLLSAVLQRDLPDNDPILREARHAQIWEKLDQIREIFKHALFRDAAYEMLLNTRRKALHLMTAEAIETLYHDRLAHYVADLALHYENAEHKHKAIEYIEKAGDQAKTQYQNQQAIRFYDRLLAQLQNTFGATEGEIDTLLKKAEILELIGEWKECQQLCEKAFQLSEQINDKYLMGQANRALGSIYRGMGKYDNAMEYFKQAIELFEILHEGGEIGRVLIAMGTIYRRKGDGDTAIACYKKALKISQKRNDLLQIAMNADNMGVVYQEVKEDYDTAMTWFQKSLQIFKDLRKKVEMSKALNNIGECYRSQGDYDNAMKHYKKALEFNEELGNKLETSIVLENIGLVCTAKGDCDTAIKYFDRAILIGRELGSKFYLCSCLIDKAEALFLLQRYKEARILNAEGIRFAEQVEDPEYLFKGNVLSTKLAFVLGDESAPYRLNDMLKQTLKEVEIAVLHYELWKMTHKENHLQIALNLYQKLYATTPNIKYKARIEEMIEYLSQRME